MAFNHLVLNESINIGHAYELLDRPSNNKDQYDLEQNNRLHLHCWHSDKEFSKFVFKAGKYNDLNPNTFLNDTSAAGFVSRILDEQKYTVIYF